MQEGRSSERRHRFTTAAVVSGFLAAGLFVSGLGSVYLYHKKGICPVLLGWWSIGAPVFWPAMVLSVVFWASLVMTTRRFRGLALFGAGLAIGVWLWFGSTSAVEQAHRQRAYRLEQGIAAAAPLPEWALSTDRNACPWGGSGG